MTITFSKISEIHIVWFTVDWENKIIYDLVPGLTSEDIEDVIWVDDSDYNIVLITDNGKIGTGSKVELRKGDFVVESYTFVLFGDVNGDEYYDGMDSLIVSCIANGMLTREQVGEAVWLAADCNHDGEINELDVEILNQAGLLLEYIGQLDFSIETESLPEEYLSLITQSLPQEDIPEKVTEVIPEPTEEPLTFFSWFKLIFEFILKIASMLTALIA